MSKLSVRIFLILIAAASTGLVAVWLLDSRDVTFPAESVDVAKPSSPGEHESVPRSEELSARISDTAGGSEILGLVKEAIQEVTEERLATNVPSPSNEPMEDTSKPPILPVSPFADTPDLVNQETFKIDPPMRDIGKAWIDGTGRKDFSMPVTGGETLNLQIDQFEVIGSDGGEFTGSVKGRPGSSVRLSYRGNSEAGTIRIPSENRIFRILPGKEGAVIVREQNSSAEQLNNSSLPPNMNIPPVPNFIPPPPPDINQLDPPLKD